MTCMITHQTLVGHLIPCLDPNWRMCNLVTHESLVGACASIGDHVFVVHSTNLHDWSPNPSWTSHTLPVPMSVPILYLLTCISKKIKMAYDTKIRITLICTIKETHDFDM